MTLLIIRHGETPLNVARVLQPADTPLSAQGQAQAEALARRLQSAGLAGVVSSDLPRALATAQAIVRASRQTPGLVLQTSALLHERNFGALRGLPYDSLGFDPLSADAAPPGGESQAQFSARCQAAWAWVLAQQARVGGALAVVTHGLVIREWLLRGPLVLAPDQALPQRLANTSLTLASAAPPHHVTLLDCTAHLAAAADGPGEDRHSLSGG